VFEKCEAKYDAQLHEGVILHLICELIEHRQGMCRRSVETFDKDRPIIIYWKNKEQ
jgi:hypothetical protein